MMATVQWATKSMMMAMARRATTLTMMAKARHTTASTTVAGATGDEVDNDGDGATGNEVNDDGDGATGYDDDDDDDVRRCQRRHQLDDERRGQQSQRATIEIAMTRRRLRIDGNDVCTLATGNDTASYEAATRGEAETACPEAEAARGREVAAARQVGRCELQQPDGEEEVEAKLRGESAAARQQGRLNNQLANKRQMGGDAYKRQTGGEASVDKRRRSAERMRGGSGAT